MTDATDPRPQETPAASPPPSAPTSPPPRARRSPLAALALLLSVVALAGVGGGGWLLWQRLQQLQQAQQSGRTELAAELAEGRDALQAQQQRLDALAQDAGRVADRAEDLQRQLAELASHQRLLDQRLNRLDAQARANQTEWLHAEAAYLARTAQIRLRFQRDVDGAIAALRLADQTLARVGVEAAPARQALNQAVDRLVTLQLPDPVALTARIDALIAKVDILPLRQQLYDTVEPPAADDQAEPAEAPQDWTVRVRRAWERMVQALSSLVVVQRHDRVEPLLTPEERHFLYHNLRLRLESARVALLQGEPALYHGSLERAIEWVERYYALGEPPVEAALAELNALRNIDPTPPLPDLTEILAPVTRY